MQMYHVTWFTISLDYLHFVFLDSHPFPLQYCILEGPRTSPEATAQQRVHKHKVLDV